MWADNIQRIRSWTDLALLNKDKGCERLKDLCLKMLNENSIPSRSTSQMSS